MCETSFMKKKTRKKWIFLCPIIPTFSGMKIISGKCPFFPSFFMNEVSHTKMSRLVHSRQLPVTYCIVTIPSVSCFAEARWCTTSFREQDKCNFLVKSIKQRTETSNEYPPGFKSYDELPDFKCVQVRFLSICN